MKKTFLSGGILSGLLHLLSCSGAGGSGAESLEVSTWTRNCVSEVGKIHQVCVDKALNNDDCCDQYFENCTHRLEDCVNEKIDSCFKQLNVMNPICDLGEDKVCKGESGFGSIKLYLGYLCS